MKQRGHANIRRKRHNPRECCVIAQNRSFELVAVKPVGNGVLITPVIPHVVVGPTHGPIGIEADV